MKEEKIMGKITVETCDIEGLKVITPAVYGDNRGYFMETYNYNDFKAAGIDQVFVQDNQSSSTKGVLRGLHFQINFPQDKLVRVVKGEVFDVAVDLRPGSSTYGKWYGVLLSAENKKQFFIPKKTKSSSLFRRILPTASMSSRMRRNSAISARISITRTMRADFSGAIRRSVWNGRSLKARSRIFPKRIRSGAASGSSRKIADKEPDTAHTSEACVAAESASERS